VSTRAIEFIPDTSAPAGEAVGLTLGSPLEAGKLLLAVSAFNLQNHTNLSGSPGISGVWSRVIWDDALLVFDGVGAGNFMRQNDIEPGCCTPGEANVPPLPGSFPFSVQRSPGSPQLTGSGEILRIRLRPRDGVTQGTGRVDIISVGIFPEVVRFRPLPTYPVPQNIFGGTFVIR
jgi:hypothetical protein